MEEDGLVFRAPDPVVWRQVSIDPIVSIATSTIDTPPTALPSAATKISTTSTSPWSITPSDTPFLMSSVILSFMQSTSTLSSNTGFGNQTTTNSNPKTNDPTATLPGQTSPSLAQATSTPPLTSTSTFIIGLSAALAIIAATVFTAAFFMWRRKRATEKGVLKSTLDCYEIDATTQRQELNTITEASELPATPQYMELEANSLGMKKNKVNIFHT